MRPVAEIRHRDLWLLTGIVAAGTALRLVVGFAGRGWEAYPDQLAWGLVLEEALTQPLRLDQLLHYPHEGGTVLQSLLALALWLVAGAAPLGVPVLSWVALSVDSASRAFQIGIVNRVFGRSSAILFGLWSVAAVPGLVSWATVNFGQHALSAWAPFALLAAAASRSSRWSGPIALGLVTGASVAWSYDSLTLVPTAAVLAAIDARPRWWRGAAAWAATTVAGLAPLAALRALFDTGFGLECLSGMSIRGIDFELPTILGTASRSWHLLVDALPATSLLPGLVRHDAGLTRLLWGLVVVMGLIFAIRRPERRAALVVIAVTVSWVVLFAASPFGIPPRTATTLIEVRHSTYILPLVVALAVHGLATSGRALQLVAVVLIALSTTGTWLNEPPRLPPRLEAWHGTGWILGRKLGHDPERLTRLLRTCPDSNRRALVEGVGWGIAATLLQGVDDPGDPRIDEVARLVQRFAPELRLMVIDGVRSAFSPTVSPRLNRHLLPSLNLQRPETPEATSVVVS